MLFTFKLQSERTFHFDEIFFLAKLEITDSFLKKNPQKICQICLHFYLFHFDEIFFCDILENSNSTFLGIFRVKTNIQCRFLSKLVVT